MRQASMVVHALAKHLLATAQHAVPRIQSVTSDCLMGEMCLLADGQVTSFRHLSSHQCRSADDIRCHMEASVVVRFVS